MEYLAKEIIHKKDNIDLEKRFGKREYLGGKVGNYNFNKNKLTISLDNRIFGEKIVDQLTAYLPKFNIEKIDIELV